MKDLRWLVVLGLACGAGCDEGESFDLGDVTHRSTTIYVNRLVDDVRDPSAPDCKCVNANILGCSLRAAVQTAAACNGPNIIEFTESGTYTLTLGTFGDGLDSSGDLDIDHDVTIRPLPGEPLSITVEASNDRVFDIQGGASVVLSGFKVAKGYLDPSLGSAANGGCVRVLESSLVTGSMIVGGAPGEECRGLHGGGIYASGSFVSLNSTMLANNIAQDQPLSTLDGSGGGLSADDSEVFITNGLMLGNEAAGSGGGFHTSGGTLSVEGLDVVSNTCVGKGGGGFAGGVTHIEDSIFEQNSLFDTTAGGGGGLYVFSAFADNVVRSTVFETNKAIGGTGAGVAVQGAVLLDNVDIRGGRATSGGGVYVHAQASALIVDSSIHRNGADDGAGLFNASELTLINSTVIDNEAKLDGGGLFTAADSFTRIEHATIWQNIAGGAGGGIAAGSDVVLGQSILFENSESSGPDDCTGPVATQGQNVIATGSCVSPLGSDATGVPGTFGAASYSGPNPSTITVPLLPGNPALSLIEGCSLDRDQRGQERAEVCDAGAYENPDE